MTVRIGTRLAQLLATHRGIMAMCTTYLVFLIAFRPATPFEWDEVQYQRALDRYDVAAHSPHPPGAPVYVAAARLLRLIVGDPQLATQLLTTLTAAAALLLLYTLALRLGGSRGEGLVAAGVLALLPGFAFHANVGMTDVPAAACTLAVLLAAAAAIDAPGRLPWLALVAAVAVGVRPQVLPCIVLPGLWAIVAAVRARRLKALARAIALGAGLSAVIWGTAIIVTGPSRYLGAVRHHAQWMTATEYVVRLPAVRLTAIARYWLISPFGTWELAAAFWLLVLSGALWLWMNGRRRALAFPLIAAVPYLVVGTFTFNMLSAVRYELPGLAVLAVLAGAASATGGRRVRGVVLAVVALWAIASLAWGMRVYILRREPAPVWASLQWVRESLDPATTLVVSDGGARPHVEYVLGRAGFKVVDVAPGAIYPSASPTATAFVTLTRLPIPGWEVLFARDWHSRRLLQLAFWRYGSYAVQRPASAGSVAPEFSPAWQVDGGTFVLWGVGQVRLPDHAAPATVTVCPLNNDVTIVGAVAGRTTVAAGACRDVVLRPGKRGGMFVIAPTDLHAMLRPLVFEGAPPAEVAAAAAPDHPPAAEYLSLLAANDQPFSTAAAAPGAPAPDGPPPRATAVPAPTPTPAPHPLYLLPVARTSGLYGAQWRTEMAVANPSDVATSVGFELLLSGRDNSAPRRARLELAPGEKRIVPDALGELFGVSGAGALRVVRDSAAVTVRARTYDSNAKAPSGPFLAGIEERAAYRPGRPADLHGLAHDPAARTRKRTNLGVLNVAALPIEVEIAVSDAEGGRIGAEHLRLAPREFRQMNDLFGAVGATAAAAGSARVTVATRGGAFLAYASVVRRDPPSVTYVLPRPARPPSPQPAGGAAVPRATPAVPSSSTALPAGGSAPPLPR